MFFTQFVLILTLMVVDPSHPNGMSPDAVAIGYSGDIGACVTVAEQRTAQYKDEIMANEKVLGYSFDCVAVQPIKPKEVEKPLQDNEKRT